MLRTYLPGAVCVVLVTTLILGGGCHATPKVAPQDLAAISSSVPRELSKVSLPTYRIEPPDLLSIDVLNITPKSPYFLKAFDSLGIELQRSPIDRLQRGDMLAVRVPGALAEAPIDSVYPIEPNGLVNFGGLYGSVPVAGMTVAEATQAIQNQLKNVLADSRATVSLAGAGSQISGQYPIQVGGTIDLGMPYGVVMVAGLSIEQAKQAVYQHLARFYNQPQVSVSLVSIGALQQIAGEHLVAPDGTVTLGTYGSVSVVGLTLAEAKMAIEYHLSQFLDRPEVAVNVFSYNSKVYYIITQGAGTGDRVYRFPVTGNDTVLDAISNVNGLEQISSKQMWIARPTPDPCQVQLLPVDWDAVTAQASAQTNYQLMPGDRLFIAEDKLIAFDTGLSKILAPAERIMGFSILGAGAVTRFSGSVLKGGGNSNSTF